MPEKSRIPKLMNVTECSEALRVSEETIKRLIYKGELKRVRIGNRILIREDHLLEFIENATK